MRLRRPEDFQRVRSAGRSWAHPLFILALSPNEGMHTRIGLSASRRVGNAVARNRARRLLREAMRRWYHRIAGGWDIVLVARSALLETQEPQVEAALGALLERAGVLVANDVGSCQASGARV
jgi:ribonuclease P protein component